MGHYDSYYDNEDDSIISARQKREAELIADGYERVPEALHLFFNKAWIHKDELRILRRWLNTCPYCKLTDTDD